MFHDIKTCKSVFEFQANIPEALRNDVEKHVKLHGVEYELLEDNRLEIRNVEDFRLFASLIQDIKNLIAGHNKDSQ